MTLNQHILLGKPKCAMVHITTVFVEQKGGCLSLNSLFKNKNRYCCSAVMPIKTLHMGPGYTETQLAFLNLCPYTHTKKCNKEKYSARYHTNPWTPCPRFI